MSAKVAKLAKQLEKLQQDDFEVCLLFVCLFVIIFYYSRIQREH